MARRLDAPVTLIHAVDLGYPETIPGFSGCLPALCVQAKEMLDRFETPGLEIPASRREVTTGSAARRIVEKAAQMETPWIMLPTRGHTRYRQMLLGSVTASVLHDALCPVWTEAHTEYAPTHSDCRNAVVCAVDLGPRTPTLLATAWELSRKLAVPLRIVHSVPGVDPRFPSAIADRAHTFLMNQAKDAFDVHCGNAETTLELEIVEDPSLVGGVVDAIARLKADLLIIGRGVIQGPLGRLRTNAHDLIRRSPCAVLSV
jgi:nucleotide-binding universal stress UspA family protein